jgi:hypothetical protein
MASSLEERETRYRAEREAAERAEGERARDKQAHELRMTKVVTAGMVAGLLFLVVGSVACQRLDTGARQAMARQGVTPCVLVP